MSMCTSAAAAAIRGTVVLAASAGFCGGLVAAQDALALPQLSPPAQVSRTIGLTTIVVDYHSPSVRGREIFGGKVPFGVVWRAGANENTTVSFSTDVTVEGQPLSAGVYGLHMIPGADSWVVIFNNDSESWGSFAYSEELDALRVTVLPEEVPAREALSYGFEEVAPTGAVLALRWASTRVPVQITVDVLSLVLAPVRDAARADDDGPGWQFWFQAGDYGRDQGVPGAETLDWTERSIAAQPTFSNLWLRSELLADQGDLDAAGEARDAALELGNLNELQSLGYRYMLRGDMENAVAVFEMVLSMDPAGWWPYVQLGEAKRNVGDDAGAIAAWRQALDKNPDKVTRSEIEAQLAKLGAS